MSPAAITQPFAPPSPTVIMPKFLEEYRGDCGFGDVGLEMAELDTEFTCSDSVILKTKGGKSWLWMIPHCADDKFLKTFRSDAAT